MENLRQAINYSMVDNVADMQELITSAIRDKIAEKMQEKRIDIAQSMFDQDDVNESYISEKITSNMSCKDIINDFVHSDDPKFKGKSKKERTKMALGAYYKMHPEERS